MLMKKFLLFALTLAFTATLFAQPSRIVKPLKASKSDIILGQPEGELRNYVRSGGCCDIVYGTAFAHDLTQEGFVRVVFAPDGKTVYIQNIISRAASGAWVRGTIEGDKLLIPYGQVIYWFDNPINADTKQPEAPYGLKLAEVTMKGAHNQYDVNTNGNVVFRIEEDGKRLVMEGCSVDLSKKNIRGLGLVYTDAYDGQWSHYMDYETVFTEVEEKATTVPDNAVIQRYSIAHGIYGHFVDVAFVDNDVYIRGISDEYVPTGWVKGSFDTDGRIHFPRQLVGSYQVYLFYFLGADIEKRDDYYGGQYSYKYNPENTEIVFEYDPETRSFWNNDRAIVVNNRRDSLDRFQRFPKPKFSPYVERAAKPAPPAIMELNDTYWAKGASISTLAISVPVFDEDGNFLDPSKLAYSLYIDDDEPYLLYQDEYEGLPVDAIEEIPYLFTNNKDIFPKSLGMYIYQNGFERMGIKSIYYGGNDRRETAIYYAQPLSVGIEEVQNSEQGEMVNGKWSNDKYLYDLSGRRIAKPTKGMYIQNGKKYIK